MTTEPKNPQHLFVIWAPDYTDEDAINRRLAVRSRHLETAKENMKSGYVTSSSHLIKPVEEQTSTHTNTTLTAGVNGPLLSPESIASPDAPKKMVGSMLVVRGMCMLI